MKIEANKAVRCLRSPLSNAEVKEKLNLTTRGADLLTKLLMNRFFTEKDSARRGIRFRMKQRQASAKKAQ